MSEFTTCLPDALASCEHESVDIRAVTCSNGAIQYVKQCLTCGEKVGSAIKHADVIAARGDLQFIAPFDVALRDASRHSSRIAALRAPIETVVSKRAAERTEALNAQRERLGDWYRDEYLLSSEWAEKRTLVIHRAGGICEGCRSRKASVVHHLTYGHVGDELLYELVALCRRCHDRAHRRIEE
jgi:hypothetical protein